MSESAPPQSFAQSWALYLNLIFYLILVFFSVAVSLFSSRILQRLPRMKALMTVQLYQSASNSAIGMVFISWIMTAVILLHIIASSIYISMSRGGPGFPSARSGVSFAFCFELLGFNLSSGAFAILLYQWLLILKAKFSVTEPAFFTKVCTILASVLAFAAVPTVIAGFVATWNRTNTLETVIEIVGLLGIVLPTVILFFTVLVYTALMIRMIRRSKASNVESSAWTLIKFVSVIVAGLLIRFACAPIVFFAARGNVPLSIFLLNAVPDLFTLPMFMWLVWRSSRALSLKFSQRNSEAKPESKVEAELNEAACSNLNQTESAGVEVPPQTSEL